MQTYYIFRHGQTDWNLQTRFQGHTDIPLNATGEAQALELRKLLADKKLQWIHSSDLDRAQKTALIVRDQQQIQITTTAELRECNLGSLEGLYTTQVIDKIGRAALDQWYSFKPEDQGFRFPGGESKAEHAARLMKSLNEFALAHADLTHIGISTHGGSLRRFLQSATNPPTVPMRIENCAVHEFRFDPLDQTLTWIRELTSQI